MRELLQSGPSGQRLVPPLWTLLPSRSKPPTPSRQEWSHMTLQTWEHRDRQHTLLLYILTQVTKDLSLVYCCWKSNILSNDKAAQQNAHKSLEISDLYCNSIIWQHNNYDASIILLNKCCKTIKQRNLQGGYEYVFWERDPYYLIFQVEGVCWRKGRTDLPHGETAA